MKPNVNRQFRNLIHWTDDPSPNEEPAFQYYMNEGVYGSFASKLSETLIAAPSVHKVSIQDSLWVKMLSQ